MGSNGEEGSRSVVCSRVSESRDSLTTLCEKCTDISINFRDVGFGPLVFCEFRMIEWRPIGSIRKASESCLFCREIYEFYNGWYIENLTHKVPFRGDVSYGMHKAFFELHKESSLSISSATNIAPVSDHGTANIKRIRIHFKVPKPGIVCPVLQFQKCSQPPLQVSNGASLSDWESAEEQPYSGRIRPLVADTRLFRKWKETCCGIHGDHCNSIFTGERLPRLRLIDVENRCVVDCFLHEKKGYFVGSEVGISYAALSYVWGRYKLQDKLFPELTEKTEWEFRKARSITREKVLSTIDDAIEVTLGLGERYLWVDCLCIRQDDRGDKGIFISQMDSIYGFASVTIVAASGDNADAGLPGIKPESRTRVQKPFTISRSTFHVTLLRTLDPEGSRDDIRAPYHYLDGSVWLTRGWTFQEKIFSRRALIFTPEQVYWECQRASWCEDSFWETSKSPLFFRPGFKDDFRPPWPSDLKSFETIYLKLIGEYSRRELSDGRDGLDAFGGIVNALRRETGQDFLWGLPKSFLGKMLTWCCEEQSIRRREERCPVRSSDTTTDCPFPSWSWVGWVGMVDSYIMQSSCDLVFYYLDGKRQDLQRVEEADDGQIHITWPKGRLVQGRSGGTGRTDVMPEEIRPANVRSQSIASNILFFWSSTAKLHVRPGDGNRDGHDNLILSHSGKDVECLWRQTPVLTQGLKDFVVIGGSYQHMLAVLVVDWKDGVAYRRGLVTIYGSHWQVLDNREWKLICLG